MKILLVSEFFPDSSLRFSGGVEGRAYFISKYLSKDNQIVVLTSNFGNKIKIPGVKVIKVGKKRYYNASVGGLFDRLNFIYSAIKKGIEIDAELIEGSNFITHLIAKKISQTKKIPVVAWYPDVWVGEWFNHSGVYGLLGEILERYNLSQKYDAFIAISNQTAKKLKRFVNKKIDVIPCGVELEEFSGSFKKFSKPTLISVGRLTNYKNHQTVISAFAKVKEKISDAQLIIVGDGPKLSGLKNQVKKHGLETDVKFYQSIPRKDLIKVLKSSHVYTLASKVEGFGIATIEACAAGLPFVISNIPIHMEVTRGGQGGFLANPENADDFAEKITKLFKSQKNYKEKSQKALELSNKYEWKTIAHETEKIYYSLV